MWDINAATIGGRKRVTTMTDRTACPFISTPDRLAACQRERCAMWFEAKDSRWSKCGVRQLMTDLHSVRFELKDSIGNVPLVPGQAIHG